jgi:hypothetical protein
MPQGSPHLDLMDKAYPCTPVLVRVVSPHTDLDRGPVLVSVNSVACLLVDGTKDLSQRGGKTDDQLHSIDIPCGKGGRTLSHSLHGPTR